MKIIEKPSATILSPPGSKSKEQTTARERAMQRIMNAKPIETQLTANTLPAHALPGVATKLETNDHLFEQRKRELLTQQAQKDTIEAASEEVSAEEMPVQASPSAPSEDSIAPPEAQAKPKDPTSEHYLRLAHREKALRAREAAVKAKEDAATKSYEDQLRAKETEYSSKYISRESLKSDPLGVLGQEGLTYDQLTEYALKSPKTPEDVARDNRERALEAKVAAMEAKLQAQEKASSEGQTRAYESAKKQLGVETRKLVQSAPDEFEAIKTTGSYSDVVELIEKTYESDGILLSVEEAARDVETYLVSEGEKMSRLKKIQARMNKKQAEASSSSTTASAKSAPNTANAAPVKNLTNANSVSTTQLSRRERAILAATGKL